MLEPAIPVRASTEAGGMHARRTGGAAHTEPEALPDLLLIERARTGDARAIEALIRRYSRRLFRIARSVLADEERAETTVCQAYLMAFADLSRYEPAGKFAAWLARLTLIQVRAADLHPGAGPATPSQPLVPHRAAGEAGAVQPGTAQAPEPVADELSPHPELEQVIDALPEVFRLVFVLRVVEGISGIETAASLGLHQTTVRTRLYRALRRLSPEVLARVRTTPTVLALSGERGERIVSRVLTALPQGSMLTISASPP
jgi:RNA polymerase sigma-70 factor, ECF subfamily